MTTETELLELAERLAKATGDEQRDLLAEAFHELHGESPLATDYTSRHATKRFAAMLRAEAYIDAAATLVPEGHKWSVTQQDSENPCRQWWGELRRGYWTSYDKAFPARGATPALALCAASLRVRATTQTPEKPE